MRETYFTAYSPETEITFILKNTFDGNNLVSVETTGFYFGLPDDENTELYKNKLKAEF